MLVADAGGTKTAAWLVETTGPASHRILGRGRATSGNPLSVGFAEATRSIMDAVGKAQNDAGGPATKISRAVLSIAGTSDPEIRNRILRWARSVNLADQITIVPDMLPILAAGTPNCVGVVLISGTGSVAFGRAADGRLTRSGGWGFLLGDDGSGFAIGRDALRQALEDRELNAEVQPLTSALFRFLKASSITDLTKAVYGLTDPRAAIASVAPTVLKAADEGNPAALAILDSAARDLAIIAARAAESLSLAHGPFPLAVAGGVLLGSKRLQDRVRAELQSMSLECDMRVVEEPLQGCLRLTEPNFFNLSVRWP